MDVYANPNWDVWAVYMTVISIYSLISSEATQYILSKYTTKLYSIIEHGFRNFPELFVDKLIRSLFPRRNRIVSVFLKGKSVILTKLIFIDHHCDKGQLKRD